MKSFAVALALGVLGGCTNNYGDWFVGTAAMAEDRTITIDVASREKNGPIAHGHFIYPVGHKQYQEILDHVGELDPGQVKPVKPWSAN